MPTPGEILARLADFGRVHVLEEVASTNDYALSLARNHEPAVIIARRQTRGRGRFRRRWYSDGDSLTATLLLCRNCPDPPLAQFITTIAGLALAQAVEDVTGVHTQLRWPNDVVWKEKKLAGLLCEGRGDAVAVGVGVNVNQSSFPDDIPEAGSLRMATGRVLEPLEVLAAFARNFQAAVMQAAAGNTAPLLAAVKERSATLLRRVEVQTLLRRYVGTVVDLDAEGRIILRTDPGRLVVLGAGQVRRLV